MHGPSQHGSGQYFAPQPSQMLIHGFSISSPCVIARSHGVVVQHAVIVAANFCERATHAVVATQHRDADADGDPAQEAEHPVTVEQIEDEEERVAAEQPPPDLDLPRDSTLHQVHHAGSMSRSHSARLTVRRFFHSSSTSTVSALTRTN